MSSSLIPCLMPDFPLQNFFPVGLMLVCVRMCSAMDVSSRPPSIWRALLISKFFLRLSWSLFLSSSHSLIAMQGKQNKTIFSYTWQGFRYFKYQSFTSESPHFPVLCQLYLCQGPDSSLSWSLFFEQAPSSLQPSLSLWPRTGTVLKGGMGRDFWSSRSQTWLQVGISWTMPGSPHSEILISLTWGVVWASRS